MTNSTFTPMSPAHLTKADIDRLYILTALLEPYTAA